ncbi:PEP-CTERM sorting domain-containing protein [Undibacterium sp. TJN25]|uniref:PEP-CTERM sorting domain-containing protein n=1 Tax=Undibacterium sp. TJN25 TaxID=3413056 RepID=UPI003BF3089E
MAISKLLKSVLLTSMLAVTSVAANATVISFTVLRGPASLNNVIGSGSFTGTDVNNDGSLSKDELTDFNFTLTQNSTTVDLTQLLQFSAFNLKTDIWTPTLVSPNSSIWFSSNNGTSITKPNFSLFTTVVSQDAPGSVPEPLTLGLFAIGLLGIGAVRRCQQ